MTAALQRRSAELCLPFAASARHIVGVRQSLTEWLRRLDWPGIPADKLVLAVHEALANVVDHAYYRASATVPSASSQPSRGVLYAWEIIEGQAGYLQRRVTAVITDYGRWKPSSAGSDRSGRGMAIMTSNTDQFHIQHSAGGTTVILTTAPHPNP
jgi:anti-sigma regulatory factor (Ser/Thr protein kinase)